MTQISTWKSNHIILMPERPNKDEKSRIGYYLDWLAETQQRWYQPDLAAYRDYLLHERVRTHPRSGERVPATLSPSTVQAHLSTIRGRYETLLRDNRIRDLFFEMPPAGASLADRKAFVDERLARLQNAIHPSSTSVKLLIQQDVAESEMLRLKPHQVTALLRAPGISTLKGLRDTAMISLMVCTGIREAELCDLDVADLRESLRDEPALRVRAGKGQKQRLIPYGPLDWCLVYVDRWLELAQIANGVVFRGFYKGEKRIRRTGITTRSVNRIMNQYPIMIDGSLRDVKPHDLRRTYARNAYENGLDLERIRQNLGHSSLQTTQSYIGELDAIQRRPPDMFSAPHALERVMKDPLRPV